MSLLDGIAVRRQTEEALYCMQTMTRVQTQIYSRRVKTEEDKKALRSQIQIKQGLDKMKVRNTILFMLICVLSESEEKNLV
jgi:hypothetical protein